MIRRISGFALWVLLGAAVALIPLACGSDNTNPNDGSMPDGMTQG
jgi:hypothetical protein